MNLLQEASHQEQQTENRSKFCLLFQPNHQATNPLKYMNSLTRYHKIQASKERNILSF
ncbi:hypothetical protein UYSO10_2510 [Kosakonia radicincitans]|nr:hypothetical protein UYSO10_2510 [Kosakonia radicincitans]